MPLNMQHGIIDDGTPPMMITRSPLSYDNFAYIRDANGAYILCYIHFPSSLLCCALLHAVMSQHVPSPYGLS